MKKWIITIFIAVGLLALALATHFWGARVIKFAVDNDKTVDSVKKLLELLLAVGGLVPPVIKFLFGNKEKEKDSRPVVTTTEFHSARDVSTAGRDVQTGGTHAESNLSVGGDLINQQTIIHQAVAPADQTIRVDELVPKPRVLDAAIPSHVVKDQLTEILILVRLPNSVGLIGSLLDYEDTDARPEDVRSKRFNLILPLRPDGTLGPLRVTVTLTSPDFSPPQQTKNLFVPPDGDSEVLHFLLTPKRTGQLKVLIELKWEDALHGSRSLRTECVAGAESVPAICGMNLVQLQMSASSKAPESQAPLLGLPHKPRGVPCWNCGSFGVAGRMFCAYCGHKVSRVFDASPAEASCDGADLELKVRKEKDSAPAPTVANSHAARDINTAGRDVQTGGTHAEHYAIGRDSIGRDKIGTVIYQTVAAAPTPAPTLNPLHQLPPPPADFTGRIAELAELRAAIEEGGVHISGLQGQGGVGKTALALKLAAGLAPNYPDAQIYLDLKGVSEKPLTAAEAMSHVLRTFHPEAKLPEKEEDLRALYLSVLHNKRALLLMDNAKDAAQVKPLIPPGSCALLVTSRQHFTMPGLQAKNLETLPPPDAKELLLQIAPRMGGEAGTIAKLCGYLPHALRLAASAIAVRVNLDPQDYSKQLADEKKRLELLAGDDESVTASIILSYNLLDAEAQKRWRMLAVFPDTFDDRAAEYVWRIEGDLVEDGAPQEAKDTLSRLLRLSMIEWSDSTKRYGLHDLMRAFGRGTLTKQESQIAAPRHAKYYLNVIQCAESLHEKGGESFNRGLALFDLERGNIQEGQAWAACHADSDLQAAKICSDYADYAANILSLRQHPRDRIRWSEIALTAARTLGDQGAQGHHLSALGLAHESVGRYDLGLQFHQQSMALAREIGDLKGEGIGLSNLGATYKNLGDLNSAIDCLNRALPILRDVGDRRSEGFAHGGLGNCYNRLQDFLRAIECYKKWQEIAHELGDPRGEGNALGGLGNVYLNVGETRHAIECYKKWLTTSGEINDRGSQAAALWNMSLALDKLGDRKKAIGHAEAALKICEEIEDPDAAQIRKQLDIWING